MTREQALYYMEQYHMGQVAGTDSSLQEAITYLATNYGSKITKWNLTVNNASTDRFDDDIKAFSYFWGTKFSTKGYTYNVDYIKAMLAVETKVGTYDGSRNGKTDVMQCLDKDNPAVYCMAKIKPTNGVSYDANEGLTLGMTSAGYTAVRNIFNGSTPSSSLYTTRLSICFGILWLGYKTALKGSTKDGVIAYNGGGDANYWTKITSCLDNPAKFFGV